MPDSLSQPFKDFLARHDIPTGYYANFTEIEPAIAYVINGNGKENNPDSAMHITNDCILFGGNNNGRQSDSAQISAGKHRADSLNILGMSTGTDWTTRKIDLWTEGGLTVRGDLHMTSNEIYMGNGDVYMGGGDTHMQNGDLRMGGGDIRMGSGDIHMEGGAFHNSDKRLKKNIHDIGDSLTKLLELRPVRFLWQDDLIKKRIEEVNNELSIPEELPEDKKQRLKARQEKRVEKIRNTMGREQNGFIAQEMEKVFPHWVMEDEDGYKSINTSELLPLLVAAVQELKKEKDDLSKQLATQNEKIQSLETALKK